MLGLKPIARVIGVILLLATIALATATGVRAQASGTPIAESNDSVSVDCSYDASSSESTCIFSLVGADSSAPDAFTILSDQLCASPLQIGSAAWDGDGNLRQQVSGDAGSASATITFPGEVTAAPGGSTYALEVGGGTTTISGDSITCAPGSGATGNGGTSGSGSPSDPTAVSVNARVFDCTTDPGSTDPASSADCTAAAGVDIGVTADGTDVGTFSSDASGNATFDVPDGSAVVATEDQSTIDPNFVPNGNGISSFTAASGAEVTFIHLPAAGMGRLQIVSGACPTSGESRTVFRVVEPNTIRAAATVSCDSTSNIAFTITGGSLGDGLQATTDSTGNWKGFLQDGDYTIHASDGTTADFTVYAGDIVVIVAIDYKAQETGALNIARWECSTAAADTTAIDVSNTAPTDSADCTSSAGKLSLAEVGSSADPAVIDLGTDGVASLDLKPGSYILTDETSGVTAPVEITAGGTVYATISAGPASPGDNTDGNASNGSGESGGGNESGNASGGDGAAAGGDEGAASGGNGSDGGNGVVALPDTGVHAPGTSDSAPITGAMMMLGLMLLTASALHRRRKLDAR